MEDDFSTFHTGNFLPFHTKNLSFRIPFHTKLSSIFHFILSYQKDKFRPEDTRNLYCTFVTLSVPLQVVARESNQYGTPSHSIFEGLSQ